MKDLSKRGLDHKEKLKVWNLWRQGKTLSEIGLTVDRHAGSIFGVLKLKGGISPVQRKRRSLYLSREERENISRGLASALLCIFFSSGINQIFNSSLLQHIKR